MHFSFLEDISYFHMQQLDIQEDKIINLLNQLSLVSNQLSTSDYYDTLPLYKMVQFIFRLPDSPD